MTIDLADTSALHGARLLQIALDDLDPEAGNAIDTGDVEELAHLHVALTKVRQQLATICTLVEQALVDVMPDKRIELDGLPPLERRQGTDRKAGLRGRRVRPGPRGRRRPDGAPRSHQGVRSDDPVDAVAGGGAPQARVGPRRVLPDLPRSGVDPGSRGGRTMSRLGQARQATRRQLKARVAFDGPSGSGKTWTSLEWATVLADGGRILVIDTEHGSASLYSDVFTFEVITWAPPYDPGELADTIREAGAAGFDVIVVDSLSHFWEGEGGTLDIVDAAAQKARGTRSPGGRPAPRRCGTWSTRSSPPRCTSSRRCGPRPSTCWRPTRRASRRPGRWGWRR